MGWTGNPAALIPKHGLATSAVSHAVPFVTSLAKSMRVVLDTTLFSGTVAYGSEVAWTGWTFPRVPASLHHRL